MKFPLSWLKEYIDCDLTPEQIGKKLTLAGLEVESIETIAPGFEKVVVGRVTHVEKHPNADKLCVATVTDGQETFQVVCGAPNCRSGMKTAFAKVGAILHDESGNSFTVKPAKLRGVESSGMLCSAKELGLGDEADGIMELDATIKDGMDIASLYADTIFDVALTPNLGHCASLIGIARELSAATGCPLLPPGITVKETQGMPIEKFTKVTVEDKKGCPRYACRVIKEINVAPSPDWMQRRLIACGLRPVNNIVDATNYVVMELGHPMHAFDYDTLDGHQIIVRSAKEGETITTLDDKERSLKQGDVLICDKSKPVALAGIMGGQNSEVSDKTRNILLEAAYFHPGTIRKTSKRLGLSTDASKRFERGADPNLALKAIDRCAQLIAEIAGGNTCTGVLDVAAQEFPEKRIICRLSRVNQILGTQLSVSEVENVFHRLDFVYRWDTQDAFTVTVPTYRVDVTQEIDLIEEVARIYGYENLTKTTAHYQTSMLPHSPLFLFERQVRNRLIAEGLQEFLTCDLIGPSLLSLVQEDPTASENTMISVMNPSSMEQSVLRTSLLPGLLQVVKYNVDHQNHDISGFEVGRVHFKQGERYEEETVVGIVLSGKPEPQNWDQKSQEADFFDLKGIVENLLSLLQIKNVTFKIGSLPTFHGGRQASIYVGDLEIGSLGEVHPSVQRRLDVPQRILFAELSLNDMLQIAKPDDKMKELAKYPGSERDWTVTVPEEMPIQELFDLIKSNSSPLLEQVSLVAIYRSEKLGPDLKNVTFHFVYRDLSKTIEQETVEAEQARITSQVMQKLNANSF